MMSINILKKKIEVLIVIMALCLFLCGCTSRKDEDEEKRVMLKDFHTTLAKHNMLLEKAEYHIRQDLCYTESEG